MQRGSPPHRLETADAHKAKLRRTATSILSVVIRGRITSTKARACAVVLAQGGNISCYSKAGFGCGRNVRCTRLGCLFAARSRTPPLRRQKRQSKFKLSARALVLAVPSAGFALGSCACALRAKQTPTQHTHGLVENAPSG